MDQIFNNNNVYILGAGFSADASIPLVKNFMFRMREAAEWVEAQESPNRDRLVSHFSNVFRFRLEASGAAYRINVNIEDIEQLFSLSSAKEGKQFTNSVIESISATLAYCQQMGDPGNETITVPRDLGDRIDDLGTYINPESLSSLNRPVELTMPLYCYYAAAMLGHFKSDVKPLQNTFITFNYDTLLEEGLWLLGKSVDYGLDRAGYSDSGKHSAYDGIPVLKLHGSVNWTEPRTQGQSVKVFRNYEEATSSGNGRVLVPPTWQKTFSGPLERVWFRAVKAITEATRLIIIGFSVPETDIHFKYLLSAGLQNNISLREVIFVNPAPAAEIDVKLKKLFHSAYMETGFVKHWQTSTRIFLGEKMNLKLIGRF